MSASMFKKLLQNLPLRAFCLNSQQHILFADPGFNKLLHTDFPLEGARFEVLIHPDERERWQMAWTTLQHQGSLKEEFRMGTLGESHILHLKKDKDNHNITFFGWMENSLLDLQKSDERLRTLLKTMPDIVCFKDGLGRWLEANTYALRLFRLEGVAYRGLTDRQLADFSPNYREALLACEKSDEAAWQSGQINREDEIILHPNGFRTVLDVIKVPTFFHDSNRKGLLVVGRDITQRRQAEEHLKNAIQAKSQFLANVSHEIRTPMNGILGMAELMMKSELSSQQQQWLRVLRSCGKNLLQLLNDILDFSKIEAKKMQLEQVSFDLIEQIEECSEIISAQAHSRNLAFSLLIEPDVPFLCKGDPTRLRQLLMNLLGNAAKFTSQGSIELHVKKVPDRNFLNFQIRDTGIGIPLERQDSLFEAFTQVDGSTTRYFGGTGLGLAICKRLVELMQGTIGFQSKKQEGSIFWFEIPYQTAESTSAYSLHKPLPSVQLKFMDLSLKKSLEKRLESLGIQPQDSPGADFLFIDLESLKTLSVPQTATHIICLKSLSQPFVDSNSHKVTALNTPIRTCTLVQTLNRFRPSSVSESPSEKTSKPDILLVEDNPINQMIAKGLLEHLGCRVQLASNGEKALQLCSNRDWDLIFMDIQMPGLDGLETTRILRRSGLLHIPIIAMTTNTQENSLQNCLEAGMNGHIEKPVHSEILGKSLKKWLGPSWRTLTHSL